MELAALSPFSSMETAPATRHLSEVHLRISLAGYGEWSL
jgi:hypothetical protein